MKKRRQPLKAKTMDSMLLRASVTMAAIGLFVLAGTIPCASGILCHTLLDDFNRADGQIGASWIGSSSSANYIIVSNEVAVLAGGPIYWEPDAFGSSQSACVALSDIVNIYKHGVLLKVQGVTPNWMMGAILVFYNDTAQKIGVRTYVPGQGWTLLALFSVPLSDGDQLGAAALNSGEVQVFVDGILVGSADAGPFFADTGGSIGLWFSSASADIQSARSLRGQPNARLDNFYGGDY
jgi:hypothetical protein